MILPRFGLKPRSQDVRRKRRLPATFHRAAPDQVSGGKTPVVWPTSSRGGDPGEPPTNWPQGSCEPAGTATPRHPRGRGGDPESDARNAPLWLPTPQPDARQVVDARK